MNASNTPPEATPDLQLEIAHLLLIDVVGYSKLLVNEQIELLQKLNQIVRATECFRAAEASDKLIRVPTGDGMALLFFQSPEEPVRCALQISKALQAYPNIHLRMGIHSGPVNRVPDVNDKTNIAGSGINVAQRVLDCGDAGHILLSRHVAEDLAQYRHWRPYLQDLGECEVKHGLRLHLFNLYKDGLGQTKIPEKLKHRRWKHETQSVRPLVPPRWSKLLITAALVVSILALTISVAIYIHRQPQITAQTPTPGVAAVSIPQKSIAVLPFENLSTKQETAFFADGVHDEILTNLAKIADLKVISRTSVMQYKNFANRNLRQISQELGVANVVEGTVQRSGNRVRVNAQLIDATTDAHVWAESYDRELADVFAIQTEIAKAIADQLRAKISPSEKMAMEKAPTTDVVAYDVYLRALALWGDVSDPVHASENLAQAVRLLDQAVSRDPNFLLAWCLLSRTHGAIYRQGYDPALTRLDLANTAVQAALRLQPDSGEAHLALAVYYYYGFRDYDRARDELAIARRMLPNNAEVLQYTGLIDRRQGHWTEGTSNLEHALELDPRNLFILQQLALTYAWQRRYAEEERIWDKSLVIVPDDPLMRISQAHVSLHWRADIKPYEIALTSLLRERPSVASDIDDPFFALCERTDASRIRSLANYPREGISLRGVTVPRFYWEGVFARCQGDQAKAEAAFYAAREEFAKVVKEQPDSAAGLSLLGIIDAGLGRKEEAIREGRRACELLPIAKDALDGTAFAINLAQIYAWTGEKDLAVEQISAIERIPNLLSYGLLKLHPYWDPLRGDSRFEQIVASLAPK